MNKLRKFNKREFKENANIWIDNFYKSYISKDEQAHPQNMKTKDQIHSNSYNNCKYFNNKDKTPEIINTSVFERNIPSLISKQLKLISDPQKQFSLLLNASNINKKEYVNPRIVMAFYNSKFNNITSPTIMTAMSKSLFTSYICFLLKNNQIEYSVEVLINYVRLNKLNLMDLENLFNCIVIEDDFIFLKFWFLFLIQSAENTENSSNAAAVNGDRVTNNNHLILIMLNHPNEKFKNFLKLFEINDLKSFNYVLNVYNNLTTLLNFDNGILSISNILNFINNYDNNNMGAFVSSNKLVNKFESSNIFLEIHNIQLNVSTLLRINPIIVLIIFEIFIRLKFEDSLILILNRLTKLMYLKKNSSTSPISNGSPVLDFPLSSSRSLSKFLIQSRKVSQNDLHFQKILIIFTRLKSWSKLASLKNASMHLTSTERVAICLSNSSNIMDLNYLIKITDISNDDLLFQILNYCLKYELTDLNYRFLMGRLLSKILGRNEFSIVAISFQKLINKYIKQANQNRGANISQITDQYNEEILNKIVSFYYYVFNHGSLNKYLSIDKSFNELLLERLFDRILLFDYTKVFKCLIKEESLKKRPNLLNFFKQLKVKDEKYLIKLINHFGKCIKDIDNSNLKKYQIIKILDVYGCIKDQSVPKRLLASILSMENLHIKDDEDYELMATIISYSSNIDYYLNGIAALILNYDSENKKMNLVKLLNAMKKIEKNFSKCSRFEEFLILNKVKYGRINESQLELLLTLDRKSFTKLDVICAYLHFLSSVDLQLSKTAYSKYLSLLLNFEKGNLDKSIVKNKMKQSIIEGVLSNEKLTNDGINKLTIFMKSVISLRNRKPIKQSLTAEEYKLYSVKKLYLKDEHLLKIIEKINKYQVTNEIIYKNPEISPRLILRFIRRYLKFVKLQNRGSIHLIRWLLFTYFKSSINNYKLRHIYPHNIEYQMAMRWYYYNSKTIYVLLSNMKTKKQGFWSFRNLIAAKRSSELLRKFHYNEE